SGPALNPMIKVVNLISILLLPLVLQLSIQSFSVHLYALGVALLLILVSFFAFYKSSKQGGFAAQE
ncbi:MAG TPA: hypothetical protein VJ044_08660, partial [Candidatus Hodarchaeales archaeon]|nr:hypothetical protein [Candidatus Hodarchaeales archaeon]